MLNTISNREPHFLDFDPYIIAQQMSLYEQDLYKVNKKYPLFLINLRT